MQSQYNNIQNNDNIEFLLVYIKKLQNIAKFRILVIDEMTLLTKAIIGKKRLNISIKKISYAIS